MGRGCSKHGRGVPRTFLEIKHEGKMKIKET
jgi:hypothetical protein